MGGIVGGIFFMFGEECIGRKKMYLGGMFTISCGMLIMFLSQSMAMAVIGQVMLGFFALVLKRFSGRIQNRNL